VWIVPVVPQRCARAPRCLVWVVGVLVADLVCRRGAWWCMACGCGASGGRGRVSGRRGNWCVVRCRKALEHICYYIYIYYIRSAIETKNGNQTHQPALGQKSVRRAPH
jgi:hypothetical protein